MENRKLVWRMFILTLALGVLITSCWSTGTAREVTPKTALTMQRVRSTAFLPDEPMQIFVDDVPYELSNGANTSIIINNGEHMVYAVLGDIESKSVRFTANSRTVIVNVTPNRPLVGRNELKIDVFEAK